MALSPGTLVGTYEVTALLGQGGMGAVYRARDTKLNRDVALKVLLPEVANDPDRLARFRREAQVLASLNHPHIGAIYGLEGREGQEGLAESLALVMELVEGPTLADRITRGPIPLDEALPIAKQIAEALEAAHEQGIIHRDLKPANIKVRDDGTVKVLDFGLAKALDANSTLQAPASSLSLSPTIASPARMTGVGVILGTAAYMAPEQARGRAVDKRADIWAFGCVLYETLTGAQPFGGDDVTEVLSRVLQREPDLAALPPATPAHVRTLVARCLIKDPRQRLRDIGEARLALDGAISTPASPTQTSSPAVSSGRVWMVALAAGSLAITALAVPAVRHLRETAPPTAPEIRTEIVTPQTSEPASFALSPDGQQLVFVASEGNGASRLWLRSLTSATVRPLAGTEEAMLPFWSPDSRSIGFFAPGSLKRIDLDSEASRVLVPVVSGTGGTWGRDGTILFAPALTATLMRVAASGGAATPATTMAAGHAAHMAPWFLPDGRRFLFQVRGAVDAAGIYLGSIDDNGTARRVTQSDGWGGVFLNTQRGDAIAGDGWLMWTRDGALLAQPLDADRAALTGEPLTVAARLGAGPTTRLSTSSNGLIAYRAETSVRRQLTWVDRRGVTLGTLGDGEVGLTSPRVSPDGRRVAVARMAQGNSDVWILDGARSIRLTFDPGIDGGAVWSPDGSRVAFNSLRTGVFNIFQKLASGAGPEERLLPSENLNIVTSWSRDGLLLYFTGDPKLGADLWVVPVAEGRAASPRVFLKTPTAEVFGAFSPDGRWVAYQLDRVGQSGLSEVYVRPIHAADPGGARTTKLEGQWQVSNGGGIRPRWRADGEELYFLDPAGMMMAVPMAVEGSALVPGTPVALFQSRIADGGVERQQATNYDVAPDGRFLIVRDLGDVTTPITLILNWRPPIP